MTSPIPLYPARAHAMNLPFFGIGVNCNGCPMHTCEDDLAIIYGYCCGCAKLLDSLPVLCPRAIICPLNGAGLCHDYEYMLRCCC
ncbi:uncharacterized protein LOC143918599 [Arctopsyche grandis]|uniref:uncharacterized protein LOC143918599 n=1 Tax=Arctopsyche grandis TaxID=121162 RepID=UPI00406D7B3C